MKSNILLLAILSLVLFSCRKKDDDDPSNPVPQKLQMKLNVADNYLYANQQAWAILSDLEGNVLACQSFKNGDKLDLQSENPFEGDVFHVTLVKKSIYEIYECCEPDWESLDFETFAFIQERDLSLIRQEPKEYGYSKIYLDLNIDNGVLEKYRLISTWADREGEEWLNPLIVPMKLDTDDVYLLVKMEGEQNWRHAFIKGAINEASISLNTSEMEAVSPSTVEVPSDFESNLTIVGIGDCNKRELLEKIWYEKGENGAIPALYPEGIFERFRSMVTLKKDDEIYQYLRLGAPVESYFPTPLTFNVENKSIQNFKFNHDSDPTVFEVDWGFLDHVTDINLFRGVNWKVWSDFPKNFVPPVLPPCITDKTPWIKIEDLRLYSVTERKYSSIANYSDYIDFYLQNPLNPIGCFENNFNTAGTLEIKKMVYH